MYFCILAEVSFGKCYLNHPFHSTTLTHVHFWVNVKIIYIKNKHIYIMKVVLSIGTSSDTSVNSFYNAVFVLMESEVNQLSWVSDSAVDNECSFTTSLFSKRHFASKNVPQNWKFSIFPVYLFFICASIWLFCLSVKWFFQSP